VILQDLDKTMSMTHARPTARRWFAVATLISVRRPGSVVVQVVADGVERAEKQCALSFGAERYLEGEMIK
jgi:hypothetical protein